MWKDLFALSRKEQYGISVLIILVFIQIIIRFCLIYFYEPVDVASVFYTFNLAADVTEKTQDSDEKLSENLNSFAVASITPFNPNKVTFEQLISLGVKQRVANNWISYLQNGGFFNNHSDLEKIYGICPLFLEDVMPLLHFNKESKNESENIVTVFDHIKEVNLNRINPEMLKDYGWCNLMTDSLLSLRNNYWFPQKTNIEVVRRWNLDSLILIKQHLNPKKLLVENFKININSADTSELTLLRGIGPVLSRRIVNYRNSLGGFVSVEQLSEVFGISTELFESIKTFIDVDQESVKPIKINTASVRQLRDHPYLNFYHASAIVKNRNKNGSYKNIEEVRLIQDLADVDWEKLTPYICLENDFK